MDWPELSAYHMPALERNAARHNMILAWMARAADAPTGEAQKWSFPEPGACAIRTDQRHGLILGELRREHCETLAAQVAGTRFKSVVGPDDAPLWFVERAEALGERFEEPMPQRIHALSEAPIYPGVPGTARPATATARMRICSPNGPRRSWPRPHRRTILCRATVWSASPLRETFCSG